MLVLFVCACDGNFILDSLCELIRRVEEVLGDAIGAAIEIEPRTLDLHKQTDPKNTPITAHRIITIRAVHPRV